MSTKSICNAGYINILHLHITSQYMQVIPNKTFNSMEILIYIHVHEYLRLQKIS